jgi:hypothetical protein
VEKEANHHVKKHQLNVVPSVQDLVNMFEQIYKNSEVNSVWFIKKEKGGNGFQDWHKDDIDYCQAKSTIVLNLCSEMKNTSDIGSSTLSSSSTLDSNQSTDNTTSQFCGQNTFMKCTVCNVHVCLKTKESATSISCAFHYHDDEYYGLGMKDCVELYNVQPSKFHPNRTYMKGLMLQYQNDMDKINM